jgi:aspartyl-tRNA(Asn)/glutamyl-tRNA(Gln) amidotransferase subunit C
MKISREDVLRVAELANLELSEQEVSTLQSQLDHILEYVGKLNELDTSNVEPLAQVLAEVAVGENPALRDDVVVPCNIATDALAAAPDPAPPYFRVPKVIDRAEGSSGDDR